MLSQLSLMNSFRHFYWKIFCPSLKSLYLCLQNVIVVKFTAVKFNEKIL